MDRRNMRKLSNAIVRRIAELRGRGYSIDEIHQQMGGRVSRSAIGKHVKSKPPAASAKRKPRPATRPDSTAELFTKPLWSEAPFAHLLMEECCPPDLVQAALDDG